MSTIRLVQTPYQDTTELTGLIFFIKVSVSYSVKN